MSEYGWYRAFPTRWNDNDVYGHVNNVVYYAAMDTAVNTWMIGTGELDPEGGDVIGVVVASSCEYHASASFPETLRVGVRAGLLRVGHDGRERPVEVEPDQRLVRVREERLETLPPGR